MRVHLPFVPVKNVKIVKRAVQTILVRLLSKYRPHQQNLMALKSINEKSNPNLKKTQVLFNLYVSCSITLNSETFIESICFYWLILSWKWSLRPHTHSSKLLECPQTGTYWVYSRLVGESQASTERFIRLDWPLAWYLHHGVDCIGADHNLIWWSDDMKWP